MSTFDGRRERTSSARTRFSYSRRVAFEDPPDLVDVAERSGDRQVLGCTMRQQQGDDSRVSWAAAVPDGEIDRLKIGPETSTEAAR